MMSVESTRRLQSRAQPILIRRDHPAQRPGSLPLPLTSFVGREREIAAVADLLRSETLRLLTLTGPGGVGKTRLAIRVAEELASDLRDRIWFVPLAAVASPELVLPTIAGSLGVPERRGRPLEQAVSDALNADRSLLVLDNFEHLIDGATIIVDLLNGCPDLRLLVTSRIVLRLSGEHVYPVPPLALPDLEEDPSGGQQPVTEAIQLFLERARAVQPAFSLTPERATAISQLCRRLDGLPLAIELAAARSPILPPAALLARMSVRLPLLTGGPRDTPLRLQTMHNAIAWSYDLLTPDEQRLMRALAVFAGGFSLEAAEAVFHSLDHQSAVPEAVSLAVIETIHSLAEKSLLVIATGQPGEARLAMLETIREFALAQVSAAGELDTARRAHARYVQELASRAAPHLPGPDQGGWLAQLDADHNNIRAALAWALDAEPEIALNLAGSLTFFYFLRGHLREGRDWIERALAAAGDSAPLPASAHALHGAGLLAHLQADDELSMERLAAARERFAIIGDQRSLARTLITSGIVAEEMGEFARAASWLGEALPTLRALGDPVGLGTTLAHLGMAAHAMGDHERARDSLEEALALQRAMGDAWGVSTSLGLLGLIACVLGEWDRAAGAYREGLSQKLGEGSAASIARCLGGLAVVATHRGQPDLAARLFGALDRATGEHGFAFSHLEQHVQTDAQAAARAKLGDATFDELWASGRTLSLAEAAQLASEPRVDEPNAPGPRLTRREIEILRLVAEGRSDREIGDALFISHRTAMRHLANVYQKLGVKTRSAALSRAHREGLI